ncbi:hypothetical protein PVT68_08940 [Microbulbifer bruguierae]|uniref:Uncharacterized protein n=1 Tax=Microbulbifer bruguierae TaxID=3029061 RepID=A0ABY8NLB7_9GAMM|nr:hypothetical protein [Microbulbifer bruguierae]WGL18408.1 hypothetical protein PVT68_08940 [Microbulbifer bruguierae]
MKLHFIEKAKAFQRTDKELNIWKSGNWVLSNDVAEASVGGDIYFHTEQAKPSYFGGEIIEVRKLQEGPDKGRYVITFKMTMAHKGVKTEKQGWGMEKKIIRV